MLRAIFTTCLYTTIFFLFISCQIKSQSVTADGIEFSNFPNESKLSFQEFLKFDKGRVRDFFLKDSSFVLWNANGTKDYFFYQYSLNDKSLISKFVKGGRGRGEGLSVFSAGIHKGHVLWFHDISLNKVVSATLPQTTGDNDSLTISEYAIPNFYSSILLMDSGRILAAGAQHTPYKIQEIDLKQGKQTTEYGSFTDVPKDIPPYSWKMAHQGLLLIQPSEEKAVLAYRLIDQLEIFDRATKKKPGDQRARQL